MDLAEAAQTLLMTVALRGEHVCGSVAFSSFVSVPASRVTSAAVRKCLADTVQLAKRMLLLLSPSFPTADQCF